MDDLQRLYQRFVEMSREMNALDEAAAVASWDKMTEMAPGSAAQRAAMLGQVAGYQHRLATSRAYRKVVEQLHEGIVARRPFTPGQKASIRAAYNQLRDDIRTPQRFVDAYARACADAYSVWERAKPASDWEAFRPHLERIVKMNRERADYVRGGRNRYGLLLEDYDETMTVSYMDTTLRGLKRPLMDLARRIRESSAQPTASELKRWEAARVISVSKQRHVCQRIATDIGFDLTRGRIAETSHPMTMRLHLDDVRISVEYRRDDVQYAMLSIVHESGHGVYAQHLPKLHYSLAAGEPPSTGMDEGIARLYELMVGQSEQFWRYAGGLLGWHIPSDFAYRMVNRYNPDCRVEGDEVTFNLHIILRYEIERDLLEGKLDVKDAPDAWNEKVRKYIGAEVPSHKDGILQDMHWCDGFGYFPYYTIGNMYAAQLFAAAEHDIPGLKDGFAEGRFGDLLAWLQGRIFMHGGEENADDLILKATGRKLNKSYLLEHLERRFGEIYKL